MTRLAVLGASGRLGRRVIALAGEHGVQLVAALTRAGSAAIGSDAGLLAGTGPSGLLVREASPDALADAQVVLDVSGLGGLAALAGGLAGRAVVSGVTGLAPADESVLDQLALGVAVVHATNFSRGVAVLARLVEAAARALPTFDVEVVEAHHRAKLDAPSGTAWTLVEAAAGARGLDAQAVARHGREGRAGPRGAQEIGVHAIRGGDVIGEHTVWLAGEGERLLLGHVATSRDTFAHGALHAVVWAGTASPGRYRMDHVLGLDASGRSSSHTLHRSSD